MSASRPTPDRPDAASIVHPAFVRDRLAPLFSPDRARPSMAGTIEIVQHDAGAFTRLRARLEGAVTSAGTIHRGPRGLVAFQVKRAVVRSLYWYVEPVVARLRESISESVDVTESVAIDAASARTELSMLRCEADELRCEVDVLRREVESLRRDLDRRATTRHALAAGTA